MDAKQSRHTGGDAVARSRAALDAALAAARAAKSALVLSLTEQAAKKYIEHIMTLFNESREVQNSLDVDTIALLAHAYMTDNAKLAVKLSERVRKDRYSNSGEIRAIELAAEWDTVVAAALEKEYSDLSATGGPVYRTDPKDYVSGLTSLRVIIYAGGKFNVVKIYDYDGRGEIFMLTTGADTWKSANNIQQLLVEQLKCPRDIRSI